MNNKGKNHNRNRRIEQEESWELAPPFDANPLEEEVMLGDAAERASSANWQTRIGINSAPLLVNETVTFLKSKNSRLRSRPAVTRYATRVGLKVLEQMSEVTDIRKRRREAYLSDNEAEMMRYSGHDYDFGKRLSSSKVYLPCWAFRNVAAAISEIADDLGLPISTVALVALIAGFAQSTEWLPERHCDRFAREVKRFWKSYLVERADVKDITT
jgi:hypothetical protein